MEVIGWILAWKPIGAKCFNFEFFAETDANGEKCKYSYCPFGDGNFDGPDAVKDVQALERAQFELPLLISGKLKKYGTTVETAYIRPVMF